MKYPGGKANTTQGRRIAKLTKLLRFVVKNNIQGTNKRKFKKTNKKKQQEKRHEHEDEEEEDENDEQDLETRAAR